MVGGDFNAAPDQLEIVAFKALLPDLHDIWATVSSEDGFTSNSPMNSMSKTSGVQDAKPPLLLDVGHAVGLTTALA